MDEIRRDLAAVFPDYSEEMINSLMDALKAGGVQTLADLEDIKEEDLFSELRPVTARRLVTWARSSKY